MTRRRATVTAAILAALAEGVPAGAQVVPDGRRTVPGDTVWAEPSQSYPAGALHAFVFGKGHRELWSTPVPAEVLDLDTFAGGLTVLGPGGGNQTRSLRLSGADGRRYNFRSLDKDASRALEPELRESAAAWILQDQISSLLPLSAMVVAPLLEAAGVPHADPYLRVMPDDARLGEFRSAFGGMLGWIEERPNEGPDGTPGFAGSTRVVGSERLFELLEEGPEHRVADRSFLRARLIDALVGDWDRHPGQWRWARFERDGRSAYEAVPRDRDWALARIDGAFTWLTWMPWPQYAGFSDEIGGAFRRTWSGQALDRRILTELTWPEWEGVVRDIVRRLDDDVVRGAVARLPGPYRERIGGRLESDLLARRDELGAFARNFYLLLAGWVDVRGTDRPELAVVRRRGADTVRVVLREIVEGRPSTFPYYVRDFSADETREVRLDMRGGDDVVRVEGAVRGRIVVRVVGGGRDDAFTDLTSGAGVHFYDHRGKNAFEAAPGTKIDTRPWEEPYDPEERTDRVPARDWGARALPSALLGFDPDWGLIAGAGGYRTEYGFRRWPDRARMGGVVGIASVTGRVHGSGEVDVAVARRTRLRLGVDAAGAEVRRFFGFGNDTPDEGDGDRFHAERRDVALGARVTRELPWGLDASVDFTYRRLRDLGNEGTVIDELRPYGYPDFDQVRFAAELGWTGTPTVGSLVPPPGVRVAASWFPSALDVEDGFGALDATAGVSFPLAGARRVPPVLALRAGGRTVWGRHPYHESAFLGGADDLRGFRNQRYAGDAAIYTNTEVRFPLGEIFFLMPGDFGVFGLADTGRVFHDSDASRTWHTAAGGGLWLAFLRSYSATVAVARGSMTAVYLTVGFPF